MRKPRAVDVGAPCLRFYLHRDDPGILAMFGDLNELHQAIWRFITQADVPHLRMQRMSKCVTRMRQKGFIEGPERVSLSSPFVYLPSINSSSKGVKLFLNGH